MFYAHVVVVVFVLTQYFSVCAGPASGVYPSKNTSELNSVRLHDIKEEGKALVWP